MTDPQSQFPHKTTFPFAGPKSLHSIFGPRLENLKLFETGFKVKLLIHDVNVDIHAENNDIASHLALLLDQLQNIHEPLSRHDIHAAIQFSLNQPNGDLARLFSRSISFPKIREIIRPRGGNQRQYIDQIRENDIVFGIGPAGTGKTYLAMAQALAYFYQHRIKKIIIARPAVEAGEKIGFLPGDMLEKVAPYLRPLYDALFDIVGKVEADMLLDYGHVEVGHLGFMRGRTLNDSFVILDEAQNTTRAQMKMILTRLGFDSRLVVTGDVSQIDLPKPSDSGLVEAQRILTDINGIAFTYFTPHDVVRHPLVKKIIQAYDRHTSAS